MARRETDRGGAPRRGGGQEPAPAPARDDAPGLLARRLAVRAIAAVLDENRALDETLDRLLAREGAALETRDKGLVRAIATVAIRHFGLLRKALLGAMRQGMPERAGPLPSILVAGAAQVLFLDVPDHAAVDLSMRLVHEDPDAERFASLANAVLRRMGREREALLAGADPLGDDTPPWLRQRWVAAYGEEAALAVARSHAVEPALDLTVKSDPEGWAERLDGFVLPTGSVRLRTRAAVASLPGYGEGAWWVQDAAAALPARLLAAEPGERIADLCAAPGGKTAQLALSGADVLAVDRSEPRLRRLDANMTRLGLTVRTLAADAAQLGETGFDAVLLDAPCSATGTLRRHPDVAWTKTEDDVFRLAALQTRLLDRAAAIVRPGGRIVFCTCSLEREEGERQVASALARHGELAREPVRPGELPGLEEAVTAEGDVRTLPSMLRHAEPHLSGLDGFFISRLRRSR